MSQLAELAQVSMEQGQAEVAQLLTIGAVRVLLHDSSNGKIDLETDKAETSEVGLEDS